MILAFFCAILFWKSKRIEVFLLQGEATRTACINTFVDLETKEKAELILTELGIPMSNAVGMFLKQVVIQGPQKLRN